MKDKPLNDLLISSVFVILFKKGFDLIRGLHKLYRPDVVSSGKGYDLTTSIKYRT